MKLIKKMIIPFMILLLAAGYLYWGNNAIETTRYTYSNEGIPQSFDGYTVVQVSDLHNKEFGRELVDKIEAEDPDIIVVTGDLIDRNRTDLTVAQTFLEQANELAPVYFVSGNHEVASGKYPEVQDILDETGTVNLDNASQVLFEDDEQISLHGMADPLTILYDEVEEEGSGEEVMLNELNRLENESSSDFNLLLSHRAELFDLYEESGMDLVFTGHAHGGQIRLPVVGGLYAPTQGFFPEYTLGEYTNGDTTMIVSRGLGNSIFPLRVFNRPELVVMTLESE